LVQKQESPQITKQDGIQTKQIEPPKIHKEKDTAVVQTKETKGKMAQEVEEVHTSIEFLQKKPYPFGLIETDNQYFRKR